VLAFGREHGTFYAPRAASFHGTEQKESRHGVKTYFSILKIKNLEFHHADDVS